MHDRRRGRALVPTFKGKRTVDGFSINYFDQIVSGRLTEEDIQAISHKNGRGGRGRPSLDALKLDIARQLRSTSGRRLRQRRLELGYTISSLAKAIGVSAARYYQWEKQFGELAQSKYLESLAKVLGVHPQWISEGSDLAIGSMEALPVTLTPSPVSRPTSEDRHHLAKRARERRVSLKLTRRDVAHDICVNVSALSSMERSLKARPELEVELKWESVLQVPAGWLRNVTIQTPTILLSAAANGFIANNTASVADEIQAIACWLSRESYARRTSDYQALSEREQRLVDIFVMRWGAADEEASTLQVIGEKFGVTRERIRQVTAKMEARATDFKGETPFLDRLASELIAFLPQTVEKLDIKFRALLGGTLSLEGVERFARTILGRSIVSLTEKPANMHLGWGVVAVDPKTHNPDVLRTVRDIATAMIRNVGAAQVNFVAGAAGASLKRGVSPDEASQMCSLVVGFEWLIEEDGWFWFGAKWENRLLTVTKKVLAVAKRRVDIEDIHEAMARARRSSYDPDRPRPYAIDAPHSVLVAILKRVPWMEVVQHDDFRLKEPVALESILSDVELALHDFLQAKGGIAARYSINKALLKEGESQLGHMALQIALDSSPIIRRVEVGIFALRGAALTPESLTVASAAVGGDLQHLNHAALTSNAEGYIAFKFEIRPYMVNSRYLEVPMRLATLIPEGEYQLDGFVERVTYAVLSNGSRRLRKFTSKLINAGFGIGDWVMLHVNPQTRRIKFEKAQSQ